MPSKNFCYLMSRVSVVFALAAMLLRQRPGGRDVAL